MIYGVTVTPLTQIVDERGKIMHMLRSDCEDFKKFGEIYFSCVFPQAIKGWHYHHKMTLNYAVIQGHIKLVLYDDREDSPTRGQIQEIFPGESNYCLITIPPNIWNAFRGLGEKMSIVANCATHPHENSEIVRIDPHDPRIPYSWNTSGGASMNQVR